MKFSSLALSLSASSTMAATLKAQNLKAQGVDVVIGTVGEPQEDVDNKIKAALIQQITTEPSRYSSAQGLLSTRKKISDWFQSVYQATYSPQQIAVTPGSKFGLYALMQILCEAGDEVIIPIPYWVSYVTQAQMAKATAVLCQPDENYKLTADTLQNVLSKKSRLLILNSPNNPSGAVYSKTELNQLYEVLKPYPDLMIICDDIYNQLVFSKESRAASLLDVCDSEFKKRMVIVHGVSKSYAMTGWRLGWVAGETELVEKLAAFSSQTLTCVPDFIQKATEVALAEGDTFVQDLRNKMRSRHSLVQKKLSNVKSVFVYPSEGAFYVWIKIIDENLTSLNIAENLLTEKGLAVVPGESFGMPHHLRLSIALPDLELEKAIDKIKGFFK